MSKRILITGKNSYIGTSFEQWMCSYPDQYIVDTVSTKNDEWKNVDFAIYDTVFHVAGIAHVDIPKKSSTDNEQIKQLYYNVNRDLTIEIAKRAKQAGVKQFIFMSSIIVYGDSSIVGKKKVITRDTIPNPTNFYGDSKLLAEQGILCLQSNDFQVVVLRPPMIYGKGSKGNYPKLAKLARVSPVFPDIDNERSMLHIDNLCEFIHLIIDDESSGIYFPQNKEYVRTIDLVGLIANIHGKRLQKTRIFNGLIRLIGKKSSLINKVFGSLVYDKEMSSYKSSDYCVRDMKQSIELTEG